MLSSVLSRGVGARSVVSDSGLGVQDRLRRLWLLLLVWAETSLAGRGRDRRGGRTVNGLSVIGPQTGALVQPVYCAV